MSEYISSGKKLGILGGGQLGKMLIQVASRWDMDCSVLDNDPDCPAVHTANHYTKGKFSDYDHVLNFGRQMDVITIEIENVNTDALKKLREEGKIVHPSPEVIETIKDKGKQKQFYLENNLATSEFRLSKNRDSIIQSIKKGEISYPFVQKLCREGYDGRGVAIIRSDGDLTKLLEGESITERLIEIEKEISVVLCRNEAGEVNVFEPVEMEFSSEANLVEMLISPARISERHLQDAVILAKKVIEALNHVGVLAVEMFLTVHGEILINESAPRPHNSGHHTIEANVSSQYEQHLRAILGFPLGSVESVSKSVMINILGEKNYSGKVIYKNTEDVMKCKGAHLHIYGKRETKPFRKMGHITICGEDMEDLIRKGHLLKKSFRAES